MRYWLLGVLAWSSWAISAHAALLPTGSFYVESGGLIVGEAEDYHDRTNAAKTWKIVPDEAITGDNNNTILNPRGGQYVQALADTGAAGANPAASNYTPFISYTINVTTPGTYRLYLRWEANGTDSGIVGSSDSLFADIVELKDGTGGAHADWYQFTSGVDGNFATNWDGSGGREANAAGPSEVNATWALTAGLYTLRFSQREDGAAIDTWVLTTGSAPTGDGPAVSPVAIPEPSTWALLLLGTGLACWCRKNR